MLVVVRPPPDVSLYHRKANKLFPAVLDALGRREDVHAVVHPAHDAAAPDVQALRFPSLIVPDRAVDAQSLIAFADLVVSAGGTMNREAVALGTPVYTTYGGRLGGVDEALIREGRLRPLTDPRALELVKQPRRSGRGSCAAIRGVAGRADARRRPREHRRAGRAGAARRAVDGEAARRALRADGARPSSRGRVDAALRALDMVLAGAGLVVLAPGAGGLRAGRAASAAGRCCTAARASAAPARCSRCTSSARCAPTPRRAWARTSAPSSRA